MLTAPSINVSDQAPRAVSQHVLCLCPVSPSEADALCCILATKLQMALRGADSDSGTRSSEKCLIQYLKNNVLKPSKKHGKKDIRFKNTDALEMEVKR